MHGKSPDVVGALASPRAQGRYAWAIDAAVPVRAVAVLVRSAPLSVRIRKPFPTSLEWLVGYGQGRAWQEVAVRRADGPSTIKQERGRTPASLSPTFNRSQ